MASKKISPDILLKGIADLVEEFPDLHDQETWETTPEDNPCGTKACIAGWACILGTNDFKQKEMKIEGGEGKGIFWIPKKRIVREHAPDYVDVDELSPSGRIKNLPTEYYAETGASLLGLERHEADLLFHGEGRPREGYTVSSALRAIANGSDVHEVWSDGTDVYDDDDCYTGNCNCE